MHQIQATRVEQHLSFTFEKNIVYWETGPLLAGPWTKITINMDNNCYWNTAGQAITFAGLTLDQWREQQKHDQHSIVADPGFVDPKNHDFHLKPDSPALKIGFEPFDYTKAGVYGDARLDRESQRGQISALGMAATRPQGRQTESSRAHAGGHTMTERRVRITHHSTIHNVKKRCVVRAPTALAGDRRRVPGTSECHNYLCIAER